MRPGVASVTLLSAAALTLAVGTLDGQRLQYVTTARQLGPIGYRDPLGVVSPDGIWLAFTSAQHVLLQRVVGGPVSELGAGKGMPSDLAWLPDGRHLAVREVPLDQTVGSWVVYDLATGAQQALWPERRTLVGEPEGAADGRASVEIAPGRLVQLAWSPDGARVAGTVPGGPGAGLWIVTSDGSRAQRQTSDATLTYPAWAPGGEVACLESTADRQRLTLPCGSGRAVVDANVYGPVAFSSDRLYYAIPNDRGVLDLWVRAPGVITIGLTHFARDAYAPSVTRSGQVLFKTQDYRVFVAMAPAGGGATRAVTTFMSENPTWSPSGDRLSVTFGNWRRVVDDFQYPDIAQDIGIVAVDLRSPEAKDAPDTVFRASPSEDQGMQWSPNGRWAAFHSHADHTDDIYLQPADRSAPPRKISEGPLRETGYARWSPDGRSILYTAYERDGTAMRPGVYIVGVDQATGAVTGAQRRIPIAFAGNPVNVEWLPDGRRLVFEGAVTFGKKTLYVVPLAGGRPAPFHEFRSDQVDSGISVSADGRWVAFIAPDREGHLQVFRVPLSGGATTQLTFDPTDKTQLAYDPTGRWIAFTIFNYQAQFWMLDP